MSGILASLRTGAWLSRERMRLWTLALLAASVLGLGYVIATSDGFNDYRARPLGTDFSSFYAAGSLVLDGQPQAPFDPAAQHRRQQRIFGPDTPFYVWTYPPFFLLVAAGLARMPYPLALAVWQAITLILYLIAIRAIMATANERAPREGGHGPDRVAGDRLWLLLALAYPAVLVNLGHGQNGFLSAALLGGGLVLLQRRPYLAGILFGLLAYKPQFGLMIPIALLAAWQWRAILAAAATIAVLALVATAALGPDVWSAFLASTRFSREVMLEAGDAGWHKLQSVFAWARMWGGSVALAYLAQGAATVSAGGALFLLWRSGARYGLKAAALAIATLLASPHSFDYDLVVLAPAIAYLAADGIRHGFGPYERTALAALWFVPLIARTIAGYLLIPLAVPLMLAVFALILRSTFADLRLSLARFRHAGR